MTGPFDIRFRDTAHLADEFASNLTNGGTFIPGATGLAERDSVEICLIHPSCDARLPLDARVVWVDPAGSGVGVALVGFDGALRDRIAAFVAPPEREAETADKESPAMHTPGLTGIHERLRHLNPVEQARVARSGNANERIALERLFGKTVWDALLQNPMLTQPEVARIARMGALPVPLLEVIVNNPAWLSGGEVRRALLSNPRLRRDLITRVLKAMPGAELRLVPKQTSYPAAVRDAARKLLSRS